MPAEPTTPLAAGSFRPDEATFSEIRLLLDFVTGSPLQTLKDLAFADPEDTSGADELRVIRSAAVLNRLNELEAIAVKGDPALTERQRTFLQLLRDALGTMVRPASGLTIAYTSMVVGNQRGPSRQSRNERARQAYAGLIGQAWRHRWAQRFLLAIALCFTVVAVWESARVALGRSLLQTLQGLHAQQLALAVEASRLEQVELQSAGPKLDIWHIGGKQAPDPAPLIRLCDRPNVLAWQMRTSDLTVPRLDQTSEATLFETPAQQNFCDRDSILAANFSVAHKALDQFEGNWAMMIGPGTSLPETLLQHLDCWVQRRLGGLCAAEQVGPVAPDHSDIELRVGPVLLVLGNYVLPIIFALLGATVYVILDFYSKIRDSLLAPRDMVLAWIRLVLGMVLGACVGLFFSASDPTSAPAGAGLASSITLSASGLAFLAGFGVEGVFGLLDSLVRRVFSGDTDKGGRVAPN